MDGFEDATAEFKKDIVFQVSVFAAKKTFSLAENERKNFPTWRGDGGVVRGGGT